MPGKYERRLLAARGIVTIGAISALLLVYGWKYFFGR
jgi:hypothetical protein